MRILHFADLHLGVESYGQIDSETGLSSRLTDFLAAFDRVVDFALKERVDLVLFCGDAYRSREPTQTQQREFARRIRRLSEGGVPVFLLAGNHDLPNAFGRATSTEIFDVLGVRNVYVSSHPDVYQVPTPGGILQVVSLPWLRRSALLSREDTRNLTLGEINERLAEALTEIVSRNIKKLQPDLPTVLAAHIWVENARVGSEKGMTIGEEHVLLLSNVARPEFDYVALGHIHRHQILGQSPPVVYSGSLERIDFGEEDDAKGFYLVEIEKDPETGERRANFNFHKITGRPFITITVSIGEDDPDPTETALSAISARQDEIGGAILRLELDIPMVAQLRDGEIRDRLKEASYFTITRNVRRESRMRLSAGSHGEITPLDALKGYLESKKVSPERVKILLEHGEKLIEEVGKREHD